MSEHISLIIKLDDVLRFVVRQTQPIAFSELTKGFQNALLIQPSLVLDRLNDLVQQGFLKVDEQGRFTTNG